VKKLDLLAATLVLVGGLNWGLVAVARFAASRVVYGLVGLAAVYGISSLLTANRRPRTHAALVGAR
jgi:uncharacterized protein